MRGAAGRRGARLRIRREPRGRAALLAAFGAAAAGCVTQPPLRTPLLAPPSLAVDCATGAVVGLRWTAPAPAQRYRIWRDGAPLGVTVADRFADATVAPATSYRYTVAAEWAGATAQSAPLVVRTPAAAAGGDAPACPSRLIRAARWDWEHGYRAAEGSDLWPVTWGQDGDVYAFFGDGGGFGGDDHLGRTSFGIARLRGPPPPTAATVANVYGGYRALHPSTLSGKANSLIAVGRDFYALAGIYRDGDAKARDPQPISGSPAHLEMAGSRGNAYSWKDGTWNFCEPTGAFCPLGFVNVGPGDAGAPDRYVYLFGTVTVGPPGVATPGVATPGVATPSAPALTYLARVNRRRLLTQTAYRYFAGLDDAGRPLWSAAIGRAQPVFADGNAARPGCGGTCAMAATMEEAVYDAPLGRYIGMAQGDYLAQTSFYEAPRPWGPWTLISYNNVEATSGGGGWGNLGTAAGGSLGVHIVNAWTSRDGRTLWMAYSSDGTAPAGALFPPAGTPLDAFHLVRADLTVDAP